LKYRDDCRDEKIKIQDDVKAILKLKKLDATIAHILIFIRCDNPPKTGRFRLLDAANSLEIANQKVNGGNELAMRIYRRELSQQGDWFLERIHQSINPELEYTVFWKQLSGLFVKNAFYMDRVIAEAKLKQAKEERRRKKRGKKKLEKEKIEIAFTKAPRTFGPITVDLGMDFEQVNKLIRKVIRQQYPKYLESFEDGFYLMVKQWNFGKTRQLKLVRSVLDLQIKAIVKEKEEEVEGSREEA